MSVVLYSRANTQRPLLPNQREELAAKVGPVVGEWVFDETGLDWRDRALPKAIELKVPIAVYRIEHLARADHRAKRLRDMASHGVLLYVHTLWPLNNTNLAQVADYTEELVSALRHELALKGADTRKRLLEAGAYRAGPPHLCGCGHKKNKHPDGGKCSLCECQRYVPRDGSGTPGSSSS